MVAENVRFDQTLRRVREILNAGVIGDPALVRISREANLRDEFLQNRRWFLDEEQAAGGIMMSGGIHDVEKYRMLVDADPVSVYAAEARPRFQSMEGDDTSTATIRFDDGTTAVLVESFTAMNVETVRGEKHTLEIDGDDGSLEVDGGNRITVYTRDRHLPWSTDPTGHRNEVERADSFRTDIEHFLQCIGTNEEPITSGRPQPRSLEIVLAAYESMESERVLSIE